MKTWRLFLILALVCGSSVLAVTLSAVESSPPTAHGRQGAAGDVAPYCDPDGELTLADAAVAIQILLGILEPCPGDLARADLAPVVTEGDEAVVDEYGCFTPDGDGALTAEDMALIFGAAVGLTCLHKPDSDGDGLSDEHEDGLGTDPDDPDSDDDGLLDGEEVHEHGTQPLVMDTDSDGYDDYAEVSWGSSPLDEASHPVLPDPEEVAPDVDSTVATDMHEATEFLYTGPSPIQIGVAAGTIEPIRTAVLRGSVTVRSRSPLNGVKITVLDHSEFGQTLTREDGRYDMAVNGGGSLTVVYEKEGYLPAQRQVDVPWRDYVLLSDVVMIPFDTQVTSIDLTEPSEYQVARGSEVTDGDGTRQATLFFPPGTRASLKLPDGRREYRSSLNVRATEYTVGESGPDAMPAELPPTSAYTYAIEFSADEAVAAGARDVRFDRPVISYTENFLDMPVGDAVPVGYYDREQGEWIAQENGRIVEILSISGRQAELDVDGSGLPADAEALADLEITEQERVRVAGLYVPGQTLWRVPVSHFSPYDCNWPYVPPDDSGTPDQTEPEENDTEDDSCEEEGSVIECQNQILGERIDIVGTPFTLNYRSDRVPGRARKLLIHLTGSAGDGSRPGAYYASTNYVSLEIRVAGRVFYETFDPAPDLQYLFVWDGLDAYGRPVHGCQPVHTKITYWFNGLYVSTPSEFEQAFARFPDADATVTANRTRQEIGLSQEFAGNLLCGWDLRGQGIGGWSLDVNHNYVYEGRILQRGDGGRRRAENMSHTITTVAGIGAVGEGAYSGDGEPATEARLNCPSCVLAGPEGGVYISDGCNNRIRWVDPDGIIHTVAGTGEYGYSGDGGPATEARLYYPKSIAFGPDGSMYIVDGENFRVRRVGPDGIITTVAGTGDYCEYWYDYPCGDGGSATEAELCYINGITVAPDGSIYICDVDTASVRRIGTDGIITTVAGTGESGFSGDGGPATEAQLSQVAGLDIGPDGSLYIADSKRNHRIRRVSLDGTITTVAGSGPLDTYCPGHSGDGGPATEAQLCTPRDVAVGSGGDFYIAEKSHISYVSRDGIISTVAGEYASPGYSGDGGPATAAELCLLMGVDIGLDGSFYIADYLYDVIRRVGPPMPGYSTGDIVIPSEDGTEVYIFALTGRHIGTLNAHTGADLYSFTYDDEGLLTQIEDGDGNITLIERTPEGDPTGIVGPNGSRTELNLDGSGYLSDITNPAGETTLFTYTDDGLLSALTNPKGGVYLFTYDDLGRLVRGEDPAGGYQDFDRTSLAGGYEVTRTTATGRTTSYRVENLPTGDRRLTNTLCCAMQTEALFFTDGTSEHIFSDGTVLDMEKGPDPRWAMQAPIFDAKSVATPGGLTWTDTGTRTVTLADPADPMSLETQTDTVSINGRTYTTVYDAATRTFTGTTPEGRQGTTRKDSQGRVAEEQVAGLLPQSYEYDAEGRLIAVTHGTGPDARTSTLVYNTEGFVDSITDPLDTVKRYAYDGAGRTTSLTLPDARVVAYGYDGNGNRTSVTPPGSSAHTFEYTPVDVLSAYIPPDAGIGVTRTIYAYNLDRQLTQIARPDGRIVEYEYDDVSRLSATTLQRGSLSYDYDSVTGRLSSITAPDGGVGSFFYDGFLPTGQTWAGSVEGSVEFTYDGAFRIISTNVNGEHAIGFQYDDDDLMTMAGALSLTYDPQNGLLSGTTIGNVIDMRSYNGFWDLTEYSAAIDGGEVFRIQYDHDKLERIVTKTETVEGATDTYGYSYDPAGRLAEVTKNGLPVTSYAYDDNGNRLSATGEAGTISAVYDDQDRLLRYGATDYTYTANGELISKEEGGLATVYAYDVLGNLISVTFPDGREIEYIVDGVNRRIGKRVNGVAGQGFLYRDVRSPVAELDGSGAVVSRFVYGSSDDTPDYMIREEVTYRIIGDHLGSPRLVINVETGEIAQRMDYDAFGRVILDTNSGFQPFGFAGGLYDPETGLVRFGARDYDAESGRWTAKDFAGFPDEETNRYVYVLNDPLNWIDTDGMKKSYYHHKKRAKKALKLFTTGLRCGDYIFTVHPAFEPDITCDPTIEGQDECRRREIEEYEKKSRNYKPLDPKSKPDPYKFPYNDPILKSLDDAKARNREAKRKK